MEKRTATKAEKAALLNGQTADTQSKAAKTTAAQSAAADSSVIQEKASAQNKAAADSAVENPSSAMRPKNEAACGASCGSLPGVCAPLAFPYIPMQDNNPVRYSRMEALETGTLFPGLNLPFKAAIQERTRLSNTALVELMALDFAIQELGLYLTTHAEDQEALQLYWSYLQMAKEGREKYIRLYGPLLETDLTPEDGFVWLKDPWPWDLGGNE